PWIGSGRRRRRVARLPPGPKADSTRRTFSPKKECLMRTVVAALLVALALAPAARAADVKLETEDQKTLYALGLALSRNLANFAPTPSELQTVEQGMNDGLFSKEKKVEVDKYLPKIQELQQARAKAAADTEKKASQPYLDKMAAEKGAKKTASGMIYIEDKPGAGDMPKPTDKVKVHYTGKLTDGTVFDSSVER